MGTLVISSFQIYIDWSEWVVDDNDDLGGPYEALFEVNDEDLEPGPYEALFDDKDEDLEPGP